MPERGIPLAARYFDAMGVRLLQGRTFTTAETFGSGGPRVAVLDETLARKLWPDGSALGQHIQWAAAAGRRGPGPPIEVVGIVAHDPNRSVRSGSREARCSCRWPRSS